MADNSSVKVAVRLRPLVKSEIERGCKNILEVFKDLSQVQVKDSEKAFTYNYILDTNSTQVDLYNACVKDIIPNLFKGFNLTILAYGQTGSGKTYSMGTAYTGDEEMGVIPRSVKEIFEFVKDNFVYDFTITVSFMELYQEILYDLLSGKPREQCTLEIREDPQRGIHIPGLSEIPVGTAQDVLNCLIKGSTGRATASTNMNAQSSRSHAIFTVNICMQARNNSEENKTAKFHLVDLAGSERPKKTGAVGTTFREGVNINKGLLVLGNVISALGEEKQENRFIPYRDSNLTRLLKDSLGGNSITLMIACVSPADYNIDETLSTLRYADRARKIKNKPIVNQDPKTALINELTKKVKLLQLQLIGQGLPANPSENVLKEITELTFKVRSLTHKLSSSLNDKAGLLEKLMVLQNSNELLNNKVMELKNNFDITLNNITFAIESGSMDSLRDCKSKFQEIKDEFEHIDAEIRKTEAEIKIPESDMSNSLTENDNNCNETQAGEINEIQETYATRQIELNDELKNVMKNIVLKESLAKEMAKNVKNMVDYENIRENELRVEALEREKNELVQQLKNAQQNCPSKLAEDRRRKVKELEAQIQTLTKKLNEQNRLIRLKDKDELRMKQLNQEILQMKQNKVKLVRTMKEESERFRSWKLKREREVAKLRQEDMKKKNQIEKMRIMHLKQQNVLKRKVEEAVASNKRLKDAIATRKAAQDFKFSGKLEKVTSWLKQELTVLLGLTEIEVTLSGLLEDRAMLNKQLDALKSDSNPDSVHMKAIEDDIELRSVQIMDMQQKLLDADEDVKNKINLDHIQTMAESKQALKVLIDEIIDLKKKECLLNIKSIELENSPSDEQFERKFYEKKLRELEEKHNVALSNLAQENEEKIAILLSQLRGIEMKSSSAENEELKKIIDMQAKKMAEQEEKLEHINRVLEESRRTNENLKSEIEETKNLTIPVNNVPDVTPPKKIKLENNTPPKRIRLETFNATFTCEDKEKGKENLLETPFNALDQTYDDPLNDPDWVQTPIGRKIMADKKNVSAAQNSLKPKAKLDFEESDETAKSKMPSKRSSDGGCACTKNCTKRCGCRKTSKKCRSTCKCNTLLCENRITTNENTDDLGATGTNQSEQFKKPRLKI